ncbi:hypothetical protein K9M47_03220 [Candidatus Gracilibacteria bacterium]|nr:hypothetical protein [Candidatus Gracilibacteria bacterium]
MFNKKLLSELIITTQKEFDTIPLNYKGRVEIKNTKEAISIKYSFIEAYIVVSDNATIKSVSGNATIKSVSDNATIKSVSDNATIKSVYDNATIKSVSGNATIKSVYDNATIESVYDNATILLMTGLASLVLLYSAKKVIAKGMNLIRQIGTGKIDLELGADVTFVQIKKTIKEDTTFKMYSKLYPVETKGKKAILYKAVHKRDDVYFSDYNNSFTYTIGETKEENCDKNKSESCSAGIHLSHLNWARLFGKNWEDLAILECETDIKDIVVSEDCDGRIRTSKIKVLRELPKDEY